MNIKIIVYMFVAGLTLLFFILSIYLYRRNQLMRETTSESVVGTVVSYAFNEVRSPVVEYLVENKRYKKSLKYSYITRISSPFYSVNTTVKDDLLDTKLRLRKNQRVSFTNVLQERWPIHSQMRVHYNPDNPKIAYVERFAPSYYWVIFSFLGVLMIGVLILLQILL